MQQFTSVLVPPPEVKVTILDTFPLYAGSALTLRCTAEIDMSVDISYTVGVEWFKSGEALDSSNRIAISNVTQLSSNQYEATVHMYTLSSTLDSGSYGCKIEVDPEAYMHLIHGSMKTDVESVTVQGIFCNKHEIDYIIMLQN